MERVRGMTTSIVRSRGVARLSGDHTGTAEHSTVRRAAYRLSFMIAALMAVASAAGLTISGLYPDGAWAREAFRGGDVTTLFLVVPVLIWSLVATMQGSLRAQAVWVGSLGYGVYNFAYYAFGAEFNDVFLLHIALLGLSIWATALAVASIDVRTIATSFPVDRAVRWVGAFLTLTGAILGGLWAVLAIRFALTGELMADIPAEGMHLVFAIDLSLLVPALAVAGVMLWRRSSGGIVFGAVMTVLGTLYQVNLLLAGLFQANANVPGVKAFPPEGVGLALGFSIATAILLGRRSEARPRVVDHEEGRG